MLALASLAGVCLTETRVLVIGSINDVALFRILIAGGVGDYLVKPLTPIVLTAALRSLGHAEAASPMARGRIVAVRGGCGAATVAASLDG